MKSHLNEIVKITINNYLNKKTQLMEYVNPLISHKFHELIEQLEIAHQEMMRDAALNGHSQNEYIFQQLKNDIDRLKDDVKFIDKK